MDALEQIKKNISTQESEFRDAVFLVVKEIRQEMDAAPLSDMVTFSFVTNKSLPLSIQRKVIKFLKNIGAIEILSTRLSKNPLLEVVLSSQKALGVIANEPIEYTLKVKKELLIELYMLYKDFYGKNLGTETFSFDETLGILSFCGKRVSFKPNSQSFAILSALINNTDDLYSVGDTFSFQEINTLVTADGSTKAISEKAFRNSVAHINEQAKSNLEMEELLVIKNGGININTKTLKMTVFEEENRKN
jgi:hypothetical protein